MGIYSGGGYNALEENNNKLLEGRLTIRPLPDQLPGFQTSLIGSIGEGNIPESPDFRLASSALSYESRSWTTVMQGFVRVEDASGDFVTPSLQPNDLKGWNSFIEIRPFGNLPIALISRFDEIINRDTTHWFYRQAIGGIAWHFPNDSKIILNVRRNWTKENGKIHNLDRLEIITEIRF